MDTGVVTAGGLVERSLGRARALGLLSELDAETGPGATTVYGEPGSPVPDAAGPGVAEMASRLEASPTGYVLFRSHDRAVALLPPFPVPQGGQADGWDTTRIWKLMSRDHFLGVVLMRLGRLAVGVFHGESLVSSKTGSRYVKGRHSAGGTSQKRFQRIREKQAREMFDKTCQVVKQQFDPYLARLDYVLLGGERHTLGAFVKRCGYMDALAPSTVDRVLDVREPGLRTLRACIATVWETRVLSAGAA
ncbi:MAG: hypothetical protein J4F43_09150 [Dehalococcoidia bacterium]|nr:hypothetical protein [Dehalococcoidia bacterium]